MMGRYSVTAGQNLFDIALHIYGSIEGIVDLMINNPDLSICDTLQTGDELLYTDGFIINADVLAYNKLHGIIPSNGERNIYYKSSPLPRIADIIVKNTQMSVRFDISGNGSIDIDWGDNSPIQTIGLNNNKQSIHHSFDNQISSARKIRFYSDNNKLLITHADFTKLRATGIFLLQSVRIESFSLMDCSMNTRFMSLFRDTYEIDFSGSNTDSLLPLLELKQLMKLNLSSNTLPQSLIDQYLISLVNYHYGRRNCIITLPVEPSGKYKEPDRDANNRYILTSGLEAVWVLTNEPTWNEGSYWKIVTNNKTYTSEHEQDGQGHI